MFEAEISICMETVSSGENSLCIMFYKNFILYDEVLKNYILIYYTVKVTVKQSRYRPGVAQRVPGS